MKRLRGLLKKQVINADKIKEVHNIMRVDVKKAGTFAAGVLFGTAGIKLLSGRDAKKAYVHCTAAALRVKKSVLDTVAAVCENADDILAEAKQLNEDRTTKEAELDFCDEAEG